MQQKAGLAAEIHALQSTKEPSTLSNSDSEDMLDVGYAPSYKGMMLSINTVFLFISVSLLFACLFSNFRRHIGGSILYFFVDLKLMPQMV